MRILHVTEAAAGGIVTVLGSFTKRQVEAGSAATVFYLQRPEGPASAEMRDHFDEKVQLRSFTGGGPKIRDYLALSLALQRAFRGRDFDVVHVHSSKAGFLARILWLVSPRRAKLFYSPHGFAFLRQDVPALPRHLFKLAERLLAPVGHGLIVTCESERQLASQALRARRTATVRTGVDEKVFDSESDPRRTERATRVKPTVVGIARVTHQKGPWRFAQASRALDGLADFVWIGGGPSEDEQKWLGDAPVRITGWQSPANLERMIDSADILLFPSLWEGMPLALIQAQARGIPAVVSDIVGNRDAVLDGTTGYVCSTDEQLVERTRKLIEDPDLRATMSAAASLWIREHHTDRDLGQQSLAIYSRS